jgi:hypothetical protein
MTSPTAVEEAILTGAVIRINNLIQSDLPVRHPDEEFLVGLRDCLITVHDSLEGEASPAEEIMEMLVDVTKLPGEFKPLTIDECEVTLETLHEDMPIRDCFDSGDPVLDEKDAVRIEKDYNDGNNWAWCCAKVTVRWNGFTGEDYLGGCNYDSEEQFKEAGGYYDDMKESALAELNNELETTYNTLLARQEGGTDESS